MFRIVIQLANPVNMVGTASGVVNTISYYVPTEENERDVKAENRIVTNQ